VNITVTHKIIKYKHALEFIVIIKTLLDD